MAINTQSADFILGKTTPGMPSYQPTVQPSPQGGGSLQGTLTTPQPQQQAQLPQPTMNLGLFGRAMDEMRGKLGQNQDLVDQKNKLLTLVYDRQLSPEEKSKLTPSQQQAIETGNMGLIQGQIRIINDTLKGRTQSIDKSISYLTDLYEKDLERAENQKQQAFNTILDYSKTLGQKPSAVAEALGYDKSLGLKLDSLIAPSSGGVGGSGGGLDYGTAIDPSTDTRLVGVNGKPIKLTGTQVDALSGFENALQQINEAKPLLSKVNTGPISGRASDVLRLFNADDPNRIALDAKLNNIKANFLKAISGAAVSESEVKRLTKFLPSINDTEQTLEIKMKELEKAIGIQRNNYLNTIGAKQTSAIKKEDSLGIR